MPRRTDISHVLVIGSGPIVIGQACEFDYSGTQACRVLRAEGMRVTLINSNPATIMTDPEFADATYVEPITAEFVEKVLSDQAAHGYPVDALLATLGGQTALNTAIALDERGVLAAVRRGADRRRHPGHPPRRGSPGVQGRGPLRGRRRAEIGRLPHDAGRARGRRRAGPARRHPAVVHHGRARLRHGAHGG